MNVKIGQPTTDNTADLPRCECCYGLGVQTLLTGERVVCKACSGSGLWTGPPSLPVQPFWDIIYTQPPYTYRTHSPSLDPPWTVYCQS